MNHRLFAGASLLAMHATRAPALLASQPRSTTSRSEVHP
ncbi:hypothetical protein SAMN05216221_4184 [Pseudomonas oryzae]|uniref:Uncharacterized protein n=1 Tax=Pseudomonas oryzae TaxID=1392877 RepID=A0A1H1ZCC4_9PSED|nr:hypothetical protein SAMN05216221_4184 [Pseudomonas oryzae]